MSCELWMNFADFLVVNFQPIDTLNFLMKHNTTLFALCDHWILSREWRVIFDYNIETECDRTVEFEDPHYGRMYFKSVKTPEFYILSCGKGHGLRPMAFPQLRM